MSKGSKEYEDFISDVPKYYVGEEISVARVGLLRSQREEFHALPQTQRRANESQVPSECLASNEVPPVISVITLVASTVIASRYAIASTTLSSPDEKMASDVDL